MDREENLNKTSGNTSGRINAPAVVAGGLATRLITEINPDARLNMPEGEEGREGTDRTKALFVPPPGGHDDRDDTEGEEQSEGDWGTPSTSRGSRRGGSAGRKASESIDHDWLTAEDEENRRVAREAARPPESMVAMKTSARHQNRRLIAVIVIVVVVALAYMVNSRKYPSEQKDDKQTQVKSQGQPAMQFTSPGDAELGTPKGSGTPFATPPPLPTAEPPPAPVPPVQAALAPPPPVEQKPDEPKFAMVMRAGDQSAKESEEESRIKSAQKRAATGRRSNTPVNDDRFQRGTRITLQLAEPLRSGIASVVTAQVLSDVLGKDGQVLIPAGSKAAIPFFPSENQGRMLNNISEPTMFITPSGDEVPLYGTVKGSDGFTGITGKVIKVGGTSTIRKVLGGVARVGERTAGQVLGGAGAAGDVGQEGIYEIDRATGGIGGLLFERSNRIVEVPAGAALTFELSWKDSNATRR